VLSESKTQYTAGARLSALADEVKRRARVDFGTDAEVADNEFMEAIKNLEESGNLSITGHRRTQNIKLIRL
jgi:hypothetical protein